MKIRKVVSALRSALFSLILDVCGNKSSHNSNL